MDEKEKFEFEKFEGLDSTTPKEIFEVLINSNSISFFIINELMAITLSNRGVKEILGFEELEGKTIDELFSKEVSNLIRNQNFIEFDFRKDEYSEKKHLFLKKEKIKNNIICVIDDLTQIKKTHKEEIKEKNLLELGRFASYVAHEIRNPITGIKAVMDIMSNVHKKEDPKFAIFQEAYASISRLENLVKDLLNFSKRLNPNFERIKLYDLLESSIALSESKEGRLKSNIEVECDDEIFIKGDLILLQQVFVNLINNALEAISDNGKIFITVVKVGGKVAVSVTDDGEGIKPEVLPHIFEPFYTTKRGGTGLGLSIVQRIVNLHKGEIKVISEPHKGTTFTIIFHLFEG